MILNPIAIFHCDKKSSYEAARQATIDKDHLVGKIIFKPNQQFEQALSDIEGFSHLWLIYQFHQNSHWKPMVLPPRGSSTKKGVFATRSPYRPNSLGLSCVKLIERKGLILFVQNFDLLDQTPIFDIKPYIAYSDSIPDANMGWLENIESEKYQIEFSESTIQKILFLETLGLHQIKNFIQQQLEYDPYNKQKKRVELYQEKDYQFHARGNQTYILSYKTWRILFFQKTEKTLCIENVFSGYTDKELSSDDIYQDHSVHQAFLAKFKTN